MTDEVIIDRQGPVLIIQLNRPQARNSLNHAVAQQVGAAVDELESNPNLRVGVLHGLGGVFSAGMDLKAYARGETPMLGDRGLCGITKIPLRKPLIAAVEGWALAAGLELLLACDFVIASSSAKFGVPEVQRSLVAIGGGALKLPQRLPFGMALELLLTGDPISAEIACQFGLVNRVVPEGEALDTALTRAKRIAANGPLAVEASKAIAYGQRGWSIEEVWEQQEQIARPVFDSEDAREGAMAFVEKRTAVWHGR
jgi:enoyl-CoA hydratase